MSGSIVSYLMCLVTNSSVIISAGSSKMYKLACVPIKDSDQTVHLCSLIWVFDGHSWYKRVQGFLGGCRCAEWFESLLGSTFLQGDAGVQNDLNLGCAHILTCNICWIPTHLEPQHGCITFMDHEMSHGMWFPTLWYFGPAKAQTSLRICAVWSEPLLVT